MVTVIDGNNAVLGRLASIIAQRAMKNEEIVIVNAERVIVNGTKEGIMAKYIGRKEMKSKDNPFKGPKFYSQPETMVRRAVKGMLPTKTARGKAALKRVKVYVGVPKGTETEKMEKVEEALQQRKRFYLRMGQISEMLVGKR